jgi:hypothetical protein
MICSFGFSYGIRYFSTPVKISQVSASATPQIAQRCGARFADIGPEIGQAAADIHFVEHSHHPNLGDVAAICEGKRRARRLRQMKNVSVLDCKKCNSRCPFRSCTIFGAVQYEHAF